MPLAHNEATGYPFSFRFTPEKLPTGTAAPPSPSAIGFIATAAIVREHRAELAALLSPAVRAALDVQAGTLAETRERTEEDEIGVGGPPRFDGPFQAAGGAFDRLDAHYLEIIDLLETGGQHVRQPFAQIAGVFGGVHDHRQHGQANGIFGETRRRR